MASGAKGAGGIKTSEFSGHQGYVVDNDADGVLGPEDTVRPIQNDRGALGKVDSPGESLGKAVLWDDPGFAAARESFAKTKAELETAGDNLSKGLKKPKDAIPVFKKIIDSNASPRLRSEAALRLSNAEIKIMSEAFVLAVGTRVEHATKSFRALQAAVREDDSNSDAWAYYGLTLVGIDQSMFSGKAQKELGVTTDKEIPKSIASLCRFPEDVTAQFALAQLLAHWEKKGGAMSDDYRRLKADVDARLPGLKAANREEAEGLEKSFKAVIDKVNKASKKPAGDS
ncbi:MAG: hypothetical protein HY903_18715 [Deltaproteobacteria bacterium]|nr:hypothetical protein [Deltaproteobacteria bacterium]